MIALRLLAPCRYLGTLPSVTAEVALEDSKLRVLLPQGSDVRLIAYVVHPPRIEGDLCAHLLLELVPGHLVVANLSPYDAAERIGYLGHTLFVPGKIYLSPDPTIRVLKGSGGEGPYVLYGHLLERFVRIKRLSQGAPEDHLARPLPVLHEAGGPEDRVRKPDLAHMLLDLPLALEVRDPCLTVSTAHRAVDEVLHTGHLRRICDHLALLYLEIVAALPEVLHGEDAVGSFQRPLHGGAVLHIALHNLGALLG